MISAAYNNDDANRIIKSLSDEVTELDHSLKLLQFEAQTVQVEAEKIKNGSPKEQLEKIEAAWNSFKALDHVVRDFEPLKQKIQKAREEFKNDNSYSIGVKASYILQTHILEGMVETIFGQFKLEREKVRLGIFDSLAARVEKLKMELPDARIKIAVLEAAMMGIETPKIDPTFTPSAFRKNLSKAMKFFQDYAVPLSMAGVVGLDRGLFPGEGFKATFSLAGIAAEKAGYLAGRVVDIGGCTAVDLIEQTGKVIHKHPELRRYAAVTAVYWLVLDGIEAAAKFVTNKAEAELVIPAVAISAIILNNSSVLQKLGNEITDKLTHQGVIISTLMVARHYLRPVIPNYLQKATGATVGLAKGIFNSVSGIITGNKKSPGPSGGDPGDVALQERLDALKTPSPNGKPQIAPQPVPADPAPLGPEDAEYWDKTGFDGNQLSGPDGETYEFTEEFNILGSNGEIYDHDHPGVAKLILRIFGARDAGLINDLDFKDKIDYFKEAYSDIDGNIWGPNDHLLYNKEENNYYDADYEKYRVSYGAPPIKS